MTANAEVVLLMTHFLDREIQAHSRRLMDEAGHGRDMVVVYNRSDDPNAGQRIAMDAPVFAFEEADIQGLGFPRKGRRLSANDVELFMLNFARNYPGYERLWVVEYDVAFTGRWSALFDAFADSDADLLATTVHRFPVHPNWENWKTVRTPKGGPPDRAVLMRAFLPCYRISRGSIDALTEAYAEGWSGHYEATVPTVIAEAGLVLEDMGGDGEFVAPGNRNRFYTSTATSDSLSPGTFVFRPVREKPGREPNRLWHPIKPPSMAGGWATGRRAELRRWILATARSGARLLAPSWMRM